MKKQVKPLEAKRILATVKVGRRFWLCTNEELKNLGEVAKAIDIIETEVFRYHVNKDKNDFEVWIRDIVKDKELAREISRIKTKETLHRKIAERVDELKNLARKAPVVKRKAVSKSKKQKKSAKKRKSAKKTHKSARKAKRTAKKTNKSTGKSRSRARKTRKGTGKGKAGAKRAKKSTRKGKGKKRAGKKGTRRSGRSRNKR